MAWIPNGSMALVPFWQGVSNYPGVSNSPTTGYIQISINAAAAFKLVILSFLKLQAHGPPSIGNEQK
jgi:hypothetical protein